jgi:hypothetical protein
MKWRMSWAVMAGLLATLVGCGAPISSLPPSAVLETYRGHGVLVSKRAIGPEAEFCVLRAGSIRGAHRGRHNSMLSGRFGGGHDLRGSAHILAKENSRIVAALGLKWVAFLPEK